MSTLRVILALLVIPLLVNNILDVRINMRKLQQTIINSLDKNQSRFYNIINLIKDLQKILKIDM